MQELATAEDVTALRIGLQQWLGRVATFQQIYAVYELYQWFRVATVAEVHDGLMRLVREDETAGWSTCAIEDEDCHCESGKIRYGHVEKSWIKKDIQGTKQWCSLGSFGGRDMAVGMLKQCQCWQTLSTKVAVDALKDSVAKWHAHFLSGQQVWSALTTPFTWAHEAFAEIQAWAKAPEPQGHKQALTHDGDAGSLWAQLHEVERWMSMNATYEQLALVALLYKWLENTGQRAKIGTMVEQGAGPHAARHRPPCEDGKPPDLARCAGYGQHVCRAGCARAAPLASARAEVSPPRPRAELCPAGATLEPLFSCDAATSRRPREGHPHHQAQHVLDASLKTTCDTAAVRDLVTVYLDCEFIGQYLRWTTDESEWLEEAYVSYVGGAKNSKYEWQATNLLRSVDVFSTRPIILVVFGDEFVPPAAWHLMPNVIVYRMKPIVRQISFNFNKMRAMISSRVAVGIQLDTDQIIAPGFDRLFAGTRREINEKYPWIMMPVHWMSRDAKRPEPYWEYAFRGWNGKHTMRWGHAHPSWSYWAMLSLVDMTFERYIAALKPGSQIDVFDLTKVQEIGALSVVAAGRTAQRTVTPGGWMGEDEDMMNVALWRDGSKKEWCKYDLEWGLFKDRRSLDRKMYWDMNWYPDGLPVIFLSMHNTKAFEITDWLLSLIARCDVEKPKLSCDSGRGAPRYCEAGSTDERRLRASPGEYVAKLCCCLEPRETYKIYWAGEWFKGPEDVPMKLKGMKKERTCLFP